MLVLAARRGMFLELCAIVETLTVMVKNRIRAARVQFRFMFIMVPKAALLNKW